MAAVLGRRGLRVSIFVVTNTFPSRYCCCYSTASAADGILSAPQKASSSFMVDYLVNSIGLSRDEAISASTKVSHLKSSQNSDLVINLFKHYGGLDQTQIRNLVSSVPQVLLHKSGDNLESKFRVFKDLGLSGSDLVELIKKDNHILRKGLATCIIPTINYLRKIMGGRDEKVVQVFKKSGWLLSAAGLKLMPPNIALLQNYGFSDLQIEKLIIRKPRIFVQKPEWLHDVMHRVEGELGISRNSKAFYGSFLTIYGTSRKTLEKKLGVFKSFGWSDSDAFAVFRALPTTLHASESAVRRKLNFYMKELGYTPAYLATYPALLTYSLDKRVKPRNEVLRILKERKLVKSSRALYSVVSLTDEKFVAAFVRPYKEEVPNLYETFIENKKQQLKA